MTAITRIFNSCLVGLLSITCCTVNAQYEPTVPVSYVDLSLSGSQKYVLRVDGQPFYMTNIQVRLDKLRYYWNWDASARNAIIAQAASDGFNTVSIPIHWYEVEPSKDNFNWEILDEYLHLIAKYNLKMELLWFGANSGGHVQWLGSPGKGGVHLRTPDYVLYSPSPSSLATTSDFTIRRDISPYTLDLHDKNLREREKLVLRRVMDHIALWDKGQGSRHTVIGVQINNEVRSLNDVPFPTSLIVSYLNDIASAVKNSSYPVWTRINCVPSETNSRIAANEALRNSTGTSLDFVGIDLYGYNAKRIKTILPYAGGNYRMIMESGAEVPTAGKFQLAALAGNLAYDHYDMCGPDGHGLYDHKGDGTFAAHGSYIEEVRVVNKLLNSDMTGIALNAQGYGLFVHNWEGNSEEPTAGVEGIIFTPLNAGSQGITVNRNKFEIMLMNTFGGTFQLPQALEIREASIGYFNADDQWVKRGKVTIAGKSISPPAGSTVRLVRKTPGLPSGISLQAEFATLENKDSIQSAITGFAGNGYVKLSPANGFITWAKVDGSSGGVRTIGIRFSNGSALPKKINLIVNGAIVETVLPATGSWENYQLSRTAIVLNMGTSNTISIRSSDKESVHIDEIQIL